MSKNQNQVPEDKLELYKQLINLHPDIELKGGKKLPYTSHNGNMYTQLTKAGKIGLRLNKEDREAFLAKYDAQLLISYSAIMKEYVEVPDFLLKNINDLLPYLEQSYNYAQTLKAKPTKKKKA